MKLLKLILKGVLLWITILSSILFILGMDSIYSSTDIFSIWFIIEIILVVFSYNILSDEEVYLLTGSKFFNRNLDV